MVCWNKLWGCWRHAAVPHIMWMCNNLPDGREQWRIRTTPASAAIHETPETKSWSLTCSGGQSCSHSCLSCLSPSYLQVHSCRASDARTIGPRPCCLRPWPLQATSSWKIAQRADFGNSDKYQRAYLDAETCPSPLGLSTPKLRQARMKHNEQWVPVAKRRRRKTGERLLIQLIRVNLLLLVVMPVVLFC